MKQRLQRLVVLGLAVATVAGSSVPAYAAEIVPNANVEATAEVPTTDGEENPDEDADAPSIQATATWNGSGDVVLQFDPNGLTADKYLGVEASVYPVEKDTGYAVYVEDPAIDFEAGTITVTEANLKGMIKFVEDRLAEDEDFHFTSGTGVLTFYFDAGNDEMWELRADIDMTADDDGTTDPDGGETQKPDGGDQKPDGGETNPDGDNDDDAQKPDGGDTQKPDGGDTQKPDGGDTQKPGEGGNQQGGEQKPNGDENNNGDTQKPSVKPQTKPEVKPQKDDTTTAPKTGDVAGVAGLMGTCAGSLGVALMALKRRFRK